METQVMKDESMNLNCPACSRLADQIKEANCDPHRQYMPMLKALIKLEQQGMIELFAGDCPLEDAPAVLDAERHYTVCHYLRCRSCGAVYFMGACIRGMPVYRRVEDMTKENLDIRLWGRYGTYYL
ncbi:MAG: hypothetical protein KH452_08110 [Clostridiales bacterium]|nr:hypothetical protein [Clostridiales bacterium]